VKSAALNQGSAQSKKTACMNGSIGFTGSAMGPVVGPVGAGASGGTSFGVSYGGSLLDVSIFLSFQAAGMVTGGTFAGVGVALQGASGAVPYGITTTTSLHSETNLGVGVEGSVSADYSSDGSFSVGGNGPGLPGYRAGAGFGAASGVGPGTTTTIGSSTLRQILNNLGFSMGSSPGC
jgi:hypothetical protein